jgi:hypothetical protein
MEKLKNDPNFKRIPLPDDPNERFRKLFLGTKREGREMYIINRWNNPIYPNVLFGYQIQAEDYERLYKFDIAIFGFSFVFSMPINNYKIYATIPSWLEKIFKKKENK